MKIRNAFSLSLAAAFLSILSCDAMDDLLFGGATMAAGGGAGKGGLSFAPAQAAPGTTISLSCPAMSAEIDYTLRFGDAAAPILGAGAEPGSIDVMIPWIAPGKVDVEVLGPGSDIPVASGAFSVIALADTGQEPGAVALSAMDDAASIFEALKADIVPGLADLSVLDPADLPAARAQFERAAGLLAQAEQAMSEMPAADKTKLDQMLLQSGAFDSSQKALALARSLALRQSGPASRAADGSFDRFRFLVAMDGLSAIIGSVKVYFGMVGTLLGFLPEIGPALAQVCGLVTVSLELVDGFIDCVIPTDLTELRMVPDKEGDTEIYLPAGGSRALLFKGTFQPGSTPQELVLDQFVDTILQRLGGKAMIGKFDLSEAASAWLESLKTYIPSDYIVSLIGGDGWVSGRNVTVDADPSFYAGGSQAFRDLMLDQLSLSWTPAWISLIQASEYKIEDESVATFDPLTRLAKGLKDDGVTKLSIGGYYFDDKAYKGPMALEKPLPLAADALFPLPLHVKKTASITPESGSKDVSIDTDFTITQLMEVSTSTVASIALSLDCSNGSSLKLSPANSQVKVEGCSVTLNPDAPLAPDATYSNARIAGLVLLDKDRTDLPLEPYAVADYSISTSQGYFISCEWIFNNNSGKVNFKQGNSATEDPQPSGYIDSGGSGPVMVLTAYLSPGSQYYSIKVLGDAPGTYDRSKSGMSYQSNTTRWTLEPPSEVGISDVVLTKVGAVGETIEGTFSGRLLSNLTDMTIRNGKFRVKRLDHQPWK